MGVKRVKTAVLISGSGSNLQALINACAKPGYPAEIALVISNKDDAYGLERARKAGIATHVIHHKEHASREAFDAALDEAIRASGAQLVCLAGFMRLLTPDFVQSWQGRMINIHPSLLPSFKGLHAHEQAIAAGVRFSGCTVHFVVPEMDAGPIILQAAVPVWPSDNAQSLGERVLKAEHQCYPAALRMLAEGRIDMKDGRTSIKGASFAESALINPYH